MSVWLIDIQAEIQTCYFPVRRVQVLIIHLHSSVLRTSYVHRHDTGTRPRPNLLGELSSMMEISHGLKRRVMILVAGM